MKMKVKMNGEPADLREIRRFLDANGWRFGTSRIKLRIRKTAGSLSMNMTAEKSKAIDLLHQLDLMQSGGVVKGNLDVFLGETKIGLHRQMLEDLSRQRKMLNRFAQKEVGMFAADILELF